VEVDRAALREMETVIRDKDVTKLVEFDSGQIDGECLPLAKCVCGKRFHDWGFILSIYEDNATECPECHRRLYFRSTIRVYEAGAPR
jgi:hypothetical protein